MKLRISSNATASSALLFIVAGLAFIEAASLPLGTPRRMGPGYFPLLLGCVQAVLAVAILLEPFKSSNGERMTFRGPAVMIGAMLGFAVLFPVAGLIPAIFGLIFIAALADPGARFLPTLAVAAGVSVLCAAIFILGLGVPMPAVSLPWGS